MNAPVMSQAELLAQIAKLQAENRALAERVEKRNRLSFKVTAKKADGKGTDGAISVYGLGKFPVTLYHGQWQRLFAAKAEFDAFAETNSALLATKLIAKS